MATDTRWKPGAMPDVRPEDRLPDAQVLSGGAFDYRHGRTPRVPGFEDLHPNLQEILIRLDEKEAATLAAGLHVLVRLDPADFIRMKSIFKFIKILYGIGWVIKWSIATFLTGLGAVSLAGDQLVKVWGWITAILKFIPQ